MLDEIILARVMEAPWLAPRAGSAEGGVAGWLAGQGIDRLAPQDCFVAGRAGVRRLVQADDKPVADITERIRGEVARRRGDRHRRGVHEKSNEFHLFLTCLTGKFSRKPASDLEKIRN